MNREPIQANRTDSKESIRNAGPQSEPASYTPPTMYVIGRADQLLQGSGRHKNDDTGYRGFAVDQH